MNRSVLMLVLTSALALVACDNKSETPKTPEDPAAKNGTTTTNATANGVTTAVAATPTPVAIADTDIVTPADFEETAEKSITPKTYKAELANLESSKAGNVMRETEFSRMFVLHLPPKAAGAAPKVVELSYGD